MVAEILGLLLLVQPGAPAGAPSPGAAVVRTADGAILGAIGARDANLIEAATLATTKAQDAAVKRFAADVLRDHQGSLTRGAALATELQVTRLLPVDPAMARAQLAQMVLLDSLSGAAFDQTFVKYVVDNYDAAIRRATDTQIPQARHANLKVFLQERQRVLLERQAVGQAWLAANAEGDPAPPPEPAARSPAPPADSPVAGRDSGAAVQGGQPSGVPTDEPSVQVDGGGGGGTWLMAIAGVLLVVSLVVVLRRQSPA